MHRKDLNLDRQRTSINNLYFKTIAGAYTFPNGCYPYENSIEVGEC